MKRLSVCMALAVLLCTGSLAAAGTINPAALDWSVQYLIDNSQTVLGQSQGTAPRDNRGLAISPDGRYLYAGYNNGPEVRMIDLTQADYTDATVARLTGVRGKSIDVDDQGRVYFAEGSSIKIYDAGLTTLLYTVTGPTTCEGVAVVREGSSLALYGTDRSGGILRRWDLTESGPSITGATLAGLGGSGVLAISGASNLRGVAVDSAGNIWMADPGADKVFLVDGDDYALTSMSLTDPMDIDFDGDHVYVTQSTQRKITVIDSFFDVFFEITPPWTDLSLDPDGQSGGGALSGIVVLPGVGFYVANEAGQTADEKSTYGRIDGQSGWIGDTFYTDLHADDNDPILHASVVPEPLSLVFFGTGLAGVFGFIARRQAQKVA